MTDQELERDLKWFMSLSDDQRAEEMRRVRWQRKLQNILYPLSFLVPIPFMTISTFITWKNGSFWGSGEVFLNGDSWGQWVAIDIFIAPMLVSSFYGMRKFSRRLDAQYHLE